MRIAYIAAGAGGMICGSCIHDNTAAAAMIRQGHEVALIPTYTPLKTDEVSVSRQRVFYGGLNVYLQQKLGLFRHTPRLLDRLLDRPRLLSWISRFAVSTKAEELGALTLSVLEGEHGHQAKELDKLIAWLRDDFRPDLVHITNSMFLGLVRRMRRELGVPVVVALQGEDLFLEELPEPYQGKVLAEMARRAGDPDRYLAPSGFYADRMARLAGIPEERIEVVPLGINVDSYRRLGDRDRREESRPTIAFLGRIAPEKGLHLAADAFALLARRPEHAGLRLLAAGWLGEQERPYYEQIARRLADQGLADRFEYRGEVDHEAKVALLAEADVFTLPTTYREPKGLPVLEALAAGTPVVQPAHGSFPELIEATGGGVLVEPGSAEALADGLASLLADPARRAELGRRGRDKVLAERNDDTMATATLAVYERLLAGAGGDRGTAETAELVAETELAAEEERRAAS